MDILFSPSETKKHSRVHGRKRVWGAAQAAQHPCTPPPCSKNARPPHTLPLVRRSTPLGPHSPKALLPFGNQFLVPDSGLPRTWHLSPSGPRALPCTPTQRPSAGFPDKGRQVGVAGGCLRLPATPPVLGPAGMVRSPRSPRSGWAQRRTEPSRRQGGRGPAWPWGSGRARVPGGGEGGGREALTVGSLVCSTVSDPGSSSWW